MNTHSEFFKKYYPQVGNQNSVRRISRGNIISVPEHMPASNIASQPGKLYANHTLERLSKEIQKKNDFLEGFPLQHLKRIEPLPSLI